MRRHAAPNFPSAANLILISKHVALDALLAVGTTFVIIIGGLDLSDGSIVGLCGMVAGRLILYGIDLDVVGLGYTPYRGDPDHDVLGIVIGAACGLLVARLNVARSGRTPAQQH